MPARSASPRDFAIRDNRNSQTLAYFADRLPVDMRARRGVALRFAPPAHHFSSLRRFACCTASAIKIFIAAIPAETHFTVTGRCDGTAARHRAPDR